MFGCPCVSCIMVFLFFIFPCSCTTYVRIRLFSVSRQGLPLRDMEEETERDKQTFVTYHFDVRICFLWFFFLRRQRKMCHPRAETVCQRTFLRPSVLVKISCRLCRLFCCCSVQCLRSSARGREQLEGAWTQSIHSAASTSLDCLARVEQTRFSPTLLSNSWRCPQYVGFARAVQFSSRIRM